MYKKLFLTLVLFIFSTPSWSEDIFDTINQKMGVSRIEYSIHRIEPKLSNDLRISYYENFYQVDIFEEQ